MKIPRVPVYIVKNGKAHRDTAMVIPESRIEIKLNQIRVAGITCRPENPEEPTVGLLINHGLLTAPEKIKSIRVYPRKKLVSIQALVSEKHLRAFQEVHPDFGEAAALPFSPLANTDSLALRTRSESMEGALGETFSALTVLVDRFQEILEVKGIFGAYHVAALADKNSSLFCQAGDVGVNVTVDRVLGKAFLANRPLRDLILLISGRLRADTVQKAAVHGIHTIMTASVITRLALEAAREYGIDIVNTREGDTLTVYSPVDLAAPGEGDEETAPPSLAAGE
jgi:FdhD protein